MTPDIRTLEPIHSVTYQQLRSIFKARVKQNEEGLGYAYVNRHDVPHMDRVANGVLHLGNALGYDREEVQAATLTSRIHDVGYSFPKDAPVANLQMLGKEIHADHAPRGAELVMNEIEKIVKTDSAVRKELQHWTDHHRTIAHNAIALHSNDVGTDDSAPKVALFTRLIDKLDNTNDRVRSTHVEAFRIAPFRSIQHIQQMVRKGEKHLLSEDAVRFGKRHGKELSEVRDHLHAVDPFYYHRLVPYAIQNQQLYVNPQTAEMVMDYDVYTSVVEELLGVPSYTPHDHLQDFKLAYGKSMMNAAHVVGILQGDRAASSSRLTVRMNYEGNETHILTY